MLCCYLVVDLLMYWGLITGLLFTCVFLLYLRSFVLMMSYSLHTVVLIFSSLWILFIKVCTLWAFFFFNVFVSVRDNMKTARSCSVTSEWQRPEVEVLTKIAISVFPLNLKLYHLFHCYRHLLNWWLNYFSTQC